MFSDLLIDARALFRAGDTEQAKECYERAFEDWQATGRDVEDLYEEGSRDDLAGVPGRLYAPLGDYGETYLERGGEWIITLGNVCDSRADLAEAERALFDLICDEDEDEGCPVGDPDCYGPSEGCHDACEPA